MEHRLFRSKHDRVLLGVCGGLAQYFHIDPVIIRVIAVLLIIPFNIFTIVAYFVLAIIIPLEGSTSTTPRDNIRENVNEIKDTGANLGQEIRTTFSNPEKRAEETDQPTSVSPPPQSRTDSTRALWVVGLIIVIIGVFFLLINIFGSFWRFLWPIALIVVGFIIIALVIRRR